MPETVEPLVVTVAHRLGRDGAKERIERGFESIRNEIRPYVSSLDYSWDGYRLDVRAAAMMQTVSGAIEVFEDHVRISLQLPWFLHMIGRTVTDRIQSRATALLEGPKAG